MNKFKEWLIKKLGGYTEHIIRPVVYQTVTFEPRKLKCSLSINTLDKERFEEAIGSVEEFEESIHEDIAKDMSKKLLEENFIKFSIEREANYTTYTGTLWVFHKLINGC